MCKLLKYIYLFGIPLLYVLPVEWQSCLHNPHKGLALLGPAFQTANGDYKVPHSRFFSTSAPPVERVSDCGGAASNRNEYQEHFLAVKAAGCVRLTTLPPSCTVVMKSGNLNFLEPSGPLWDC